MVWRWGMGKSGLIGNFHAIFAAERWQQQTVAISEETKTTLDHDVQDILNTCLKEVRELLAKESALLERFAQELFQKEELNYDEIETIFKEAGLARPQ